MYLRENRKAHLYGAKASSPKLSSEYIQLRKSIIHVNEGTKIDGFPTKTNGRQKCRPECIFQFPFID